MRIIEKKEFNEETITTDRWAFMEYISSRIYFLKLRVFQPKFDLNLEKGKDIIRLSEVEISYLKLCKENSAINI